MVTTDILTPEAPAVSNTAGRFSIVSDALVNGKQHSADALDQYLNTLLESLAVCRLAGTDGQPIDVRVMHAIDRMQPGRQELFQLLSLIVARDNAADLHSRLRKFLGRALALKQAPHDVVHFNHLWVDPFRFVLRELFLSLIAMLIVARRFSEAAEYLSAEYVYQSEADIQRHSFLRFDAYLKTLDEFRNRRLGLNRLSVASDLIMERAVTAAPFDAIMQADFVLCLRGLLHYPDSLVRWFPRTLVHAERYERHGFDLFFTGRSRKEFAAVCTLLGVRDKRELLDRFEAVARHARLGAWHLGGVAIPFDSFMGLAALDTNSL